MKAAAANDVQQIGELLAKGIDIEAGDMVGVTALCCAAESGALQAFNFLLAKCAHAKVVTSGGGNAPSLRSHRWQGRNTLNARGTRC